MFLKGNLWILHEYNRFVFFTPQAYLSIQVIKSNLNKADIFKFTSYFH